MLMSLYTITSNPKYKYYAFEMFKFALDTPTLSDPSHMVSYDCLGEYSAFIDSKAAGIGFFSDMLELADKGKDAEMWMIGWSGPKAEKKTQFLKEWISLILI